MLSRSPSPSSLFQDTPPMDDGFMVVPVWEPLAEVQIGSVVLEDPFLGFGRPSSPARTPASKAFAVATADAAFVGPASSPAHPPHSHTHAPLPQAAAYLPYPPAPQPQSQPPPPPVAYTQQPQPQPVPYAPPHHAHHHGGAAAAIPGDFFEETSEEGLGWWEESGPVSAFDAVDGTAPDLLSHQNSVEHFLGYPEQEEVTISSSSSSVVREELGPLKSPEDILNEIYAEANQLESEASERGASASPDQEEEGQAWWDDSPSATDSTAPSPLDAAFDDTFKRDILQAVSGQRSSGSAVLSLEAGTLPAEALTAGRQLNLVLHIKEPLSPASAHSRKRQGPKIRATVSIAPAKKLKRTSSAASKAVGPRFKKGEAKERKKAQNRVAATKYREKKRSARDILLRELEVEEEKRDRLKRQEEDAANEIAYLRDLLQKVQTKKDQEVVI